MFRESFGYGRYIEAEEIKYNKKNKSDSKNIRNRLQTK